jgi:hypothetical protein
VKDGYSPVTREMIGKLDALVRKVKVTNHNLGGWLHPVRR